MRSWFRGVAIVGSVFGGLSVAVAQDAAPIGIVDAPCTAALSPEQDWPNLCRFRADNARLAEQPQSERRVVFLGDSITEGWDFVHSAALGPGAVNRGISGQTTPQMVLRFMADVVTLHPRVVHIMAGTNDLAGNTGPQAVADVKNNVIAMVTLAKANHIRVILASIPPTNAFPWRAGVKPGPQLRALNAWLKDYARQSGAVYADYFAVLATPDGAMQPRFTADGVHPNAVGYAAMEPVARRAIAAALR